jgi:F-type H+-transporting ATPase subunit delta
LIDAWELIAAPQSIYKSQDVVQVNIPAESGEMGVLANHVPSIEQLKPGLVEVVEESAGSKQFFRTSLVIDPDPRSNCPRSTNR